MQCHRCLLSNYRYKDSRRVLHNFVIIKASKARSKVAWDILRKTAAQHVKKQMEMESHRTYTEAGYRQKLKLYEIISLKITRKFPGSLNYTWRPKNQNQKRLRCELLQGQISQELQLVILACRLLNAVKLLLVPSISLTKGAHWWACIARSVRDTTKSLRWHPSKSSFRDSKNNCSKFIRRRGSEYFRNTRNQNWQSEIRFRSLKFRYLENPPGHSQQMPTDLPRWARVARAVRDTTKSLRWHLAKALFEYLNQWFIQKLSFKFEATMTESNRPRFAI